MKQTRKLKKEFCFTNFNFTNIKKRYLHNIILNGKLHFLCTISRRFEPCFFDFIDQETFIFLCDALKGEGEGGKIFTAKIR